MIKLFQKILTSQKKSIDLINYHQVIKFVKLLKNIKKNKQRVVVVGNGGSAGIASHISTDLIKNAKIKSLTLSDLSLLTCLSNDYGFENYIEKAFATLLNKDDLVILISSSGKSKNMLNAAKYCNLKKIKLVTLTGFSNDNPLKKMGIVNFWVNSKSYNNVENTHQFILTTVIDLIIWKNYY
jgi:D-sedoheptulose 7-phosphate isomerase